jgi:hypothetical protein
MQTHKLLLLTFFGARVALFPLAACNKEQPVATAPTASTAGATAAKPSVGSAIAQPKTAGSDAAPAPDIEDESDDPIGDIVARAFGGKKPALPLLSKDGNNAAVEMREFTTGVRSYGVGFVAPRGKAKVIELVDWKQAEAIAQQRLGGEPATKIDSGKIASVATKVKEELTDFTAFEGVVDEIGVPDFAEAGPFKLQTTQTAKGALTLTVHENGKQIGIAKLEPQLVSEPGDGAIIAWPTPVRAWYDNARKRLLVHVSWTNVPDASVNPPDIYRLFEGK